LAITYNKELLLCDVAADLTVGMKILFNGDGPYKSDKLISGVITEIKHFEDKNKTSQVNIRRDDNINGSYEDGTWFIRCSSMHKTVTVVIPSLDDAKPIDSGDLKLGDVVSFINGPYEHIGMFLENTGNGLTILQTFGERSDGRATTLEIPSSVSFCKLYNITPSCSQTGCTRTATLTANGLLYCSEHAQQLGRIVRCADCGRSAFEHSLHAVTRTSLVCGVCYNERAEGTKFIRSHSYKPFARFMVAPEEDGKMALFAGLEVEVEITGYGTDGMLRERHELAKQLQSKFSPKSNPWLYVKHDGSLNNGFEIVTHPATPKVHKGSLPWKEMLEWLQSQGVGADKTSTCGLHIHVNKNYMTEEEQMKLGYFINTHKTKTEAVARRSSAQWSKFKDADASKLEDMNKCTDGDRYQALNWMNTYTVEFRIFKGTVNYDVLMGSLEFVIASVEFVKSMTIAKLKEKRKAWTEFISFVLAGDYPHLVAHLKNVGVIE
jgi:hypothetical protein